MNLTTGPASRPAPLTERELGRYHEDGFLLKRGLTPRELIQQLSHEIDALHERMAQAVPPGADATWERLEPGKPKRLMQVMNSEVVSPTINRVIRSEAILDVVAALIGPDISLYHSKLLMKSARDGAITPWHQDFVYWAKVEQGPVQLNCMIAIDPATKENGCIQFVPGSHKQGLLTHEQRTENFNLSLPGKFHERLGAVYCEMQPGDCVFFGSLVVHGSEGNNSPYHRRANTVVYTVTDGGSKFQREVLRGRGRNAAAK